MTKIQKLQDFFALSHFRVFALNHPWSKNAVGDDKMEVKMMVVEGIAKVLDFENPLKGDMVFEIARPLLANFKGCLSSLGLI